jgi:UDP-N-acetylglucosamine--N-acetylmuramyl-(pentapeptide) pyrophosphoryl-undecaprenol N-acetylglucosamine transferase
MARKRSPRPVPIGPGTEEFYTSTAVFRINGLILEAVPWLRKAIPGLLFVHLTGADNFERVRRAYAKEECLASVHAFLAEMGSALAAADMDVSRAGASSFAELAARQVPAILIPYPSASDNHQYHNALAYGTSGAARMIQRETVTGQSLAREILDLLKNSGERTTIQSSLRQWYTPIAASKIAHEITGSRI